jgi:hypothetical protein
MEQLLKLRLRSRGNSPMPFIWFWPEGFQACAIMTHDVETRAGRDFTSKLMDIDDSFGIKSSFQIVPEDRYPVSHAFRQSITERSFEVNVHGLNHRGNLFATRRGFEKDARRINEYAGEYGALGFRSPVMYRNPDWFSSLQFRYDMSVPNVAHLDPQRGGCCTVMPYFIGNVLELPLTTTQDYSLFNVIREGSIELWKWQVALVLRKHGLASFLVHPDYIIDHARRATYISLLEFMTKTCAKRVIWSPLPREVDKWWRERSQMSLDCANGQWRITGRGSERARLATARLVDGEIVYQIQEANLRAVS